MSLTFGTNLSEFAATRMPQWLRVNTSDHRTNPPQYTDHDPASFSIEFNTVADVDDTIIISLEGLDALTFTCVAALSGTGLEFTPGTGATDQAQQFMEGLLQNPWFTEHFEISTVAAAVHFDAREPGATYDLTTAVSSHSGLITVAVATVSGDAEYNPNYSLIVRPFIGDEEGNYRQVGEFDGVPDHAYGVDFPVDRYLNGELEPDWPPVFVSPYNLAFTHVKSVRNWFAHCYARHGTPPTSQAVRTFGRQSEALSGGALYTGATAVKRVWLAGAQDRERFKFDAFVLRARGITGTPPHPFMTWRNRRARRYVTRRERHWLGWYHWPMLAEASTYQVQAKLYMNDGTVVDWTDRYDFAENDTQSGIPRGRLGSVAVGFEHLYLQALIPEDAVLERYSVRIRETETGPKSEELTFWMAEEGWNDQYLWFISSLGCCESLRCTGAWSLTVQHTAQELRRPVTRADQGVVDTNTITAEATGGQWRLKLFTGFLPRAEYQAILDVLGTPRDGLRWVDATNNRLLPVRIVESEEVVADKRGETEEHLFGLNLELLLDDPEPFHTLPPTTAEMTHNEDDDTLEAEPEEPEDE